MKEANALSSLVGMIAVTSIIVPYNPLSIYLPAVMIARIASNALDFSIGVGIFSISLISVLAFLIAIRSVGEMRNNFV
jgi:hypothetical protein